MSETASFESTVDRLQEAHWHLHQMELHYHNASAFRFSLSSFLRSLKEVPSIVAMESQNDPVCRDACRKQRQIVSENKIFKRLGQLRDVIVHKSMIVPLSSVTLGSGNFRGMKIGMGAKGDPRNDSDFEMALLVKTMSREMDVFHIFVDDEDYLPCVHREWRLTDFPEQNILQLASSAWTLAAGVLAAVELAAGRSAQDSLVLACVHDPRPRFYPRNLLRKARALMDAGRSVEYAAEMLSNELGP